MRPLYLLLCGFLFAGILLFAQDEAGDSAAEAPVSGEDAGGIPWGDTVPEQIRRPNRSSETVRYPEDVVIGSLGRGDASQEAYTFARSILDALLRGSTESPVLAGIGPAWVEEILAALEPISAVKYRIGSGREETDGSTSFLFRYIGREQGIAGEFYVRKDENNKWQFDDILLEDPHDVTKRIEPYSYDFTPYERFF
jgi:hypothetical protein